MVSDRHQLVIKRHLHLGLAAFLGGLLLVTALFSLAVPAKKGARAAGIKDWMSAQTVRPAPLLEPPCGVPDGVTLDTLESAAAWQVGSGQQAISVTLQTVAGHTDNAVQISYHLSSTKALTDNWVQIKRTFSQPLTLPAGAHLRFFYRGSLTNTLQAGLVDANGQTYFSFDMNRVTQVPTWTYVTWDLQGFQNGGQRFTYTTPISAIFISIKNSHQNDVGGLGTLLVDDLQYVTVASRTTPTAFEPVTPNPTVTLGAAIHVAAQQQPSGLLRSWPEEYVQDPGKDFAWLYDQAVGLIVLSETDLPQAATLANTLHTLQNDEGSWYEGYHYSPTGQITRTDWITTATPLGANAWAVYALMRYYAHSGDQTALHDAVEGANWLAGQQHPDGSFPALPGETSAPTEPNLGVWWALRSTGYHTQANRLQAYLLDEAWDAQMGRFKASADSYEIFLDNQTWGAAFLKAIGRDQDARRALSYARWTLATTSWDETICGFDGAGPFSVWNEGTLQYIAAGGENSQVYYDYMTGQQAEAGSLPGSPDSFEGYSVWLTRMHGVAPTAWLYFAGTGGPFKSLQQYKVLVDDFRPQPVQGGAAYLPHNRLGGDRAPIGNVADVAWGKGRVTATIPTGETFIGLWTALNHPIADHQSIDFGTIFPPQIEPEFQGQLTGLQIDILDGSGVFQVELKAQDPAAPGNEITRWLESAPLSGGPVSLHFSPPITLGEIQNLNWLVLGTAGDFVVVDRVAFTATVPALDLEERAFLWSYGMLLNNWDPASGLTRDRADWAANHFDNVSASGVQAAAAAVAWQQGYLSQETATEIVTRTTEALLALPDCNGLWPHFVRNGQIAPDTEWSSIDTIIAILGLLTAHEALGLDLADVEQALSNIDWQTLVVEVNGMPYLSHGYITDCSAHIQAGDTPAIWKDFGTESWLVNLGYAAATGMVAGFDHITPTANGSGFIDELAWLFVPTPERDRWGTRWQDYSQWAADCQLAYYDDSLRAGCLYNRPYTIYESVGLFGLSAGEVPDFSEVPPSATYQAFGVGGISPPNDGFDLSGYAVIVPHYPGLIASLRPTQTFTAWRWIEENMLFTPLNNVESFGCRDEGTCGLMSGTTPITWNALKGSWNLSLQTLGFGRHLAGADYPLYPTLTETGLLQRGYRVMTECSQGPLNGPISKTHNLDETAKDWGVFCEPSSSDGLPTWELKDVLAPSLNGGALQCSLTGGDPYANVHCYRHLPPEPIAALFTMTTSFLFTPTTTCNNQGGPSVVQALEFTMNKWQAEKRYEFALQWQNVGAAGAPQWRYWDPHQVEDERWLPFTPPISQCLSANTWYTLTLTGEIINDLLHYRHFALNQDSYPLDIAVAPVTATGEADRLAVAVQLDGNASQSPYDLFLDQVSFVRAPRLALAVSKQADRNLALPGEPLTYTIYITNTGNITLTAAITDTLPDQVSTTHPIVWAPITIAPGQVWTQTLPVTVETGCVRPLMNKIEVTTQEGVGGGASVTAAVNPYCRLFLPVVLK